MAHATVPAIPLHHRHHQFQCNRLAAYKLLFEFQQAIESELTFKLTYPKMSWKVLSNHYHNVIFHPMRLTPVGENRKYTRASSHFIYGKHLGICYAWVVKIEFLRLVMLEQEQFGKLKLAYACVHCLSVINSLLLERFDSLINDWFVQL